MDALLVATGRSPNVAGLGLEAAGVQYSMKDGIKVGYHAVGPPCSVLCLLFLFVTFLFFVSLSPKF